MRKICDLQSVETGRIPHDVNALIPSVKTGGVMNMPLCASILNRFNLAIAKLNRAGLNDAAIVSLN